MNQLSFRETVLTWVDRIVAAIVTLCAVILLVRAYALDGSRLFGSAARAAIAYTFVISLALLLVRTMRSKSGAWRVVGRTALLLMAVVLLTTVISRRGDLQLRRSATQRQASSMAGLAEETQARWALRIALHASTAEGGFTPNFAIPSEWPMPDSAVIAVESLPRGGYRLHAAVGERICSEEISVSRSNRHEDSDRLSCRVATWGALPFRRPKRDSLVRRAGDTGPAPERPWLQYRGEPDRSASRSGRVELTQAWHTELEAGARASPSVVGSTVLIGTHGGGSLEAFELATGHALWRVRLPNWIHQDAVSDGRSVLVGFGDNWLGRFGGLPSGVTALDLRSGRTLWTAFERSSVMTSPVIRDDAVIYITFSGAVRKRRISDGALLDTASLPGGAVMAPPLIRGDTIVASLEPGFVCAMSSASLDLFWCTTLPKVGMAGHAAPALIGDAVFVSGPADDGSIVMQALARLTNMSTQQLVTRIALPWSAGQQVVALDLRSGAVRWSSEIFQARRAVVGHTSGTAISSDSSIIVNLPIADRVIAFSRDSLTVRWSADAGNTRGPVLAFGNSVYYGTGSGFIKVLEKGTGLERCSVAVPHHFDRAGPVLADGLLLFASIEGYLVAIPRDLADRCDKDAIRAAFPAVARKAVGSDH